MSEYIKREQVLKLLESAQAWSWSMNTLHSEIQALPAEDAVPVVHGRWESEKNPNWPAHSHDKCSLCGWRNMRNALCYGKGYKAGYSLNYYPNCGAKMDLEG